MNSPKQLELLTANQARNNYADDRYISTLVSINEAITEASRKNLEVVINVPNHHTNNRVIKKLAQQGFDCYLFNDPDNGSSEITVRWY